jgi:NDP-sugar pyrophosphorylase family protein
MKAGIIAAGEGSRLRTEGIGLPKPLVPVKGVPLVERLLRSYAECGISEAVCIVNEFSPEVREFLESHDFGMPVQVIVKTTPSSMHSLFALAPFLGNETFVLSTVDSIFQNDDLKAFIAYSRSHAGLIDGTLAVTDFIDDEKPLYVRADRQRKIIAFEKDVQADPQWVTGGIYSFSPSIFNEMEEMTRRSVERLRNFLSHLITKGYTLHAFPFSKIVDIDHAADILVAEEWLSGQH